MIIMLYIGDISPFVKTTVNCSFINDLQANKIILSKNAKGVLFMSTECESGLPAMISTPMCMLMEAKPLAIGSAHLRSRLPYYSRDGSHVHDIRGSPPLISATPMAISPTGRHQLLGAIILIMYLSKQMK